LLFLALLAAFIGLSIWLLPKIWRGIRRVFAAVGRMFGVKERPLDAPMAESAATGSPAPSIPKMEPRDNGTS
jgi:hypothetical protein